MVYCLVLISMDEAISDKCAIVVAHTLHDVYGFMKDLQHRGREAAGIAAIGDTIDVLKWIGPVSYFDLEDLHKIFPGSAYHTFLGHLRYATKGRKEHLLQDAHPHAIGGEFLERGDHLLIRDCQAVIVHNGQVNVPDLEGIVTEKLTTDCDSEALLHYYMLKGERQMMQNITGAYTLAIADTRKKDVIVMRDRTGIKPGVLGFKDGRCGVASEDVAFRKNGGKVIENLQPGAIYYLGHNGEYTKEVIIKEKLRQCFFEWNYITDAETVLNRVPVKDMREILGETLAEEFHPDDADIVTFLPRCPEAAARAYARTTSIPFLPVFYKVRAERSFMGSTETERKDSINFNLHLLPGYESRLRDKTIVLMDDSTIRGNNCTRARDVLLQAGVQKIYHLNYTPPIGIIGADGIARGCEFGVDMPPTDTFIARGRTREEISAILKMEVHYISAEGMLRSFEKAGIARSSLCTYCIGGNHPFR